MTEKIVVNEQENKVSIPTVEQTYETAKEKLIALSFKKDELKKQYEELNTELEQVLTYLGVDTFFQDKDGTVYKVVVPKGSFVSFKHIDFVRTKRGDEKLGTLSMKEAQALMDSIKK